MLISKESYIIQQAHVIPLTGLEEYQGINQSHIHQHSSVSHRNSTGRENNRKGSVLNEEEKRKRKRLTDAKYRKNKRAEIEKLKYEINNLRNMLQASDQGRETVALSIPGTVQQGDRDSPSVPRILQENQALRYAQDDIRGPFSVVIQDEHQRHFSAVLQNDVQKHLDEIQFLSQPELFPTCYFAFMEKLDRDERSSILHSDFKTLLQGERKEIGGYRIPLVLYPVFEKIVTSYGDITSNCLLSTFSAENVLLQFLASIKEMEDTSFEQVTEDLIMKWRDCIAEAKRIKFDVNFATQYLKKIAKFYMVQNVCNELRGIDQKIQVLEKGLNDLKTEKHEKLKKYSSLLLDASKDFHGTVGLF